MQKKIIALAVAGLVSGMAFAQSNVTIYGIADANWYYAKSDDAKRTGIDSGGWSGSRIGFKGEEALGNGLKAIFTVEFGYNIDENTGLGDSGGTSTRQSFVGLDTSVGAFTVGRQYAPSFMIMGRNTSNDVTGNYPLNSFLGDLVGTFVGGTMTTGGTSRWNNSIAYQSKNWSGFSVRAIYGFGENIETSLPGSPDLMDDGRFGLSGSYANGPFNIDLIYQTRLEVGGDDDVQEWYIGGGYDFKVVKITASYLQSESDVGLEPEAKVWTLGAMLPVSAAGKVRFEYADSRYKVAGSSKPKTYGFGIGYTHELSKRTMLYSSLSFLKNKNKDGWSLPLGYKGVGEMGESNWSIITGIRHSF